MAHHPIKILSICDQCSRYAPVLSGLCTHACMRVHTKKEEKRTNRSSLHSTRRLVKAPIGEMFTSEGAGTHQLARRRAHRGGLRRLGHLEVAIGFHVEGLILPTFQSFHASQE